MKQFCTIGAAAQALGVSKDTLRFYEKCGLIHPLKRDNGYRLYSPKDMDRLAQVIFYRKQDFSLEDIRQLLFSDSAGAVLTLMEEKLRKERRLLQEKEQLILDLERACRKLKASANS